MQKKYEKKYHLLEEENWWHKGRRDLILRLISKNKKQNILDIGCSSGALLKLLELNDFKELTGIDNSKEAIKECKKRGLNKTFVMDGSKLNFPDNKFEIIIASDILEHIKDDKAALSEWFRIVKPGGKMILFVPAFNFLWSNHDVINKHYRRYYKNNLEKIIKESGFVLKKVSFWSFTLFLPVSLVKIFQRYFIKNSSEQMYNHNEIINKILLKMILLENKIIQRLNLFVGTSLLIVAEKPNHKNPL